MLDLLEPGLGRGQTRSLCKQQVELLVNQTVFTSQLLLSMETHSKRGLHAVLSEVFVFSGPQK